MPNARHGRAQRPSSQAPQPLRADLLAFFAVGRVPPPRARTAALCGVLAELAANPGAACD